jgi:hypothetical protein
VTASRQLHGATTGRPGASQRHPTEPNGTQRNRNAGRRTEAVAEAPRARDDRRRRLEEEVDDALTERRERLHGVAQHLHRQHQLRTTTRRHDDATTRQHVMVRWHVQTRSKPP